MAINSVDNVFVPYRPINIKPKVSVDSTLKGKSPDESYSFDKIFNQALNKGLKFSGHAINRLQSRNIEFTPEDIDKLNNAIQKARQRCSGVANFIRRYCFNSQY